MKDGYFITTLKKKDGEIVHVKGAEKVLQDEFMRFLPEGQTMVQFIELNAEEATLGRLAKVHKCIRELAATNGETFIDMKIKIKDKAGLCLHMGDKQVYCKSFAHCSAGELDLAIQACIALGDFLNINLR